ncbi:MAG: hypothetical protein JSS32_00655 [Verrucomicrobia bacterium]|nr:hypothetical protein [Verrucomicrobiota bacterium]
MLPVNFSQFCNSVKNLVWPPHPSTVFIAVAATVVGVASMSISQFTQKDPFEAFMGGAVISAVVMKGVVDTCYRTDQALRALGRDALAMAHMARDGVLYIVDRIDQDRQQIEGEGEVAPEENFEDDFDGEGQQVEGMPAGVPPAA